MPQANCLRQCEAQGMDGLGLGLGKKDLKSFFSGLGLGLGLDENERTWIWTRGIYSQSPFQSPYLQFLTFSLKKI